MQNEIIILSRWKKKYFHSIFDKVVFHIINAPPVRNIQFRITLYLCRLVKFVDGHTHISHTRFNNLLEKHSLTSLSFTSLNWSSRCTSTIVSDQCLVRAINKLSKIHAYSRTTTNYINIRKLSVSDKHLVDLYTHTLFSGNQMAR